MNSVLVTIACEASELSGLRRRLRRWLDEAGVEVATRDAVVLGVHEATANAIEHSGRSETIQVGGSIEARTLTIDVTDMGTWGERTEADDEGGRGLLLIRELARRVEIRAGPGGTTVRMIYEL
jgi:anti-sigma regulatory factor (Ser/Thr protein kinase)